MNIFQPSPAFQAYYAAVLALAEGPVTAGGPVTIPMPTLPDTREAQFAATHLAPLVNAYNAYRASVTPAPPDPNAVTVDYNWSSGGNGM